MPLRGRSDFARVLSGGARVRVGPLALAVAEGTDPEGRVRLGVTVRARGGAVLRNRIRRRIKEVVRAAGAGGVDLVVRTDERVLAMDFQELVNGVAQAVRR